MVWTSEYSAKGVLILGGIGGEPLREGRTEERHDLQMLRNRRTSMLELRRLPIIGHSSLGSSDQSTRSPIENRRRRERLAFTNQDFSWH